MDQNQSLFKINPASLSAVSSLLKGTQRAAAACLELCNISSYKQVMKSYESLIAQVRQTTESLNFSGLSEIASTMQKQQDRMALVLKVADLKTLQEPTRLTRPVEGQIIASSTKQDETDKKMEQLVHDVQALSSMLTKSMAELKKMNDDKIKKPYQIELVLTSDGDLCLGEDRYELKRENNRIKIVYSLLEATNNFIKTKELQALTNYQTIGSLRDAIKEINGKASMRLNLKPDKGNLIEGRNSDGYRINKNYFIIRQLILLLT